MLGWTLPHCQQRNLLWKRQKKVTTNTIFLMPFLGLTKFQKQHFAVIFHSLLNCTSPYCNCLSFVYFDVVSSVFQINISKLVVRQLNCHFVYHQTMPVYIKLLFPSKSKSKTIYLHIEKIETQRKIGFRSQNERDFKVKWTVVKLSRIWFIQCPPKQKTCCSWIFVFKFNVNETTLFIWT